ncbi:MAG: hypothetical protein NTZ44_03670 [Candidatus Nomurabacteria bacterium]|nr:hypothetical protein [Candidatus Nomurabacteria bacterium]
MNYNRDKKDMEHQSESKICQNCKTSFIIKEEDFNFYEKIKVPPPTFCPECRNIQRFATRNSKSLYKRACDGCKKEVISRFSPHNPAVMYCRDCWWSDNWDALSFAKDYDFSKTFFEQFKELLFSVPHVSLLNNNMHESDYSNMESDDKRCYLTFGGHYNEDCAFTEYSLWGREVYDSYWSLKSEQCHGCSLVERCYRTYGSEQCYDCLDTLFSFDCTNCSNIIGCIGLRNKSYCIFNQQYSKEEFFEIKENLNIGSYRARKELEEKSKTFWLSFPHKESLITHSNDCTGNSIVNSKNSKNIWQADSVEDSKYSYIAAWNKNCYDETSAGNDELCYLCANGGGLYNSIAILYSFGSNVDKKKQSFNCGYSYTVLNCTDCFGCVGIRNKQYCILNKQYTKEEYFELLEKIKKSMLENPFQSQKTGQVFSYGDFFPSEHSLFAYNETVAQDLYPKDKDSAEAQGFVWREEPEPHYDFNHYQIPDDIKDVDDSILSQVLKCEESGKGYKIARSELAFYQKMQIPIPRISPLIRIRDRVRALLPFKLFDRQCQKCNKDIKTPYSPERPEIIYCEKCYQQEVY